MTKLEQVLCKLTNEGASQTSQKKEKTSSDNGQECGDTCEEITTGRNAKESEWQAAWYDGECKDANRETTKWLIEHVDKLTGGKKGCRILVPMCGAVRDMNWLVEQGHTVIGIELVDKALQLFLSRHSVEHEVTDLEGVKNGKCYKSKDGKVTLYRCNIFDMDMSLIGKVDGIWDSGAMTDILPAERKQYGEILLSALSPGGRILAETFTFGEIKAAQECDEGHKNGNQEDYDFPCRPVEMRDFEQMYGSCCTIELIEEKDSTAYGCEEWGPNWWAKERLHLVTVKGGVPTSEVSRKREPTDCQQDAVCQKKNKDDEQ